MEKDSGEAFGELVRGRIDFVYNVALRRCGDAHLARDVAQNVFLDLARRASVLRHRLEIVSWLYTSTRYAAAHAARTESRWKLRTEMEAAERSPHAGEGEPAWEDIRPIIDSAMDRLEEKDRTAILLRFFEGCSLSQVGAALGTAENAARMRVDRALEKLRRDLSRRGVTSTAAALTSTLLGQPIARAPAGLAAELVGSSLSAGLGAGAITLMTPAKIAFGLAGLAALVGLGLSVAKVALPQLSLYRRVQADIKRIVTAKPVTFEEAVSALPPELLPGPGVLRSFPSLAMSPETVTTVLSGNLERIQQAAAAFERGHGRRPESFAELLASVEGRSLTTIRSVEGENYGRVDLSQTTLAIYSPLGRSVTLAENRRGSASYPGAAPAAAAAEAYHAYQRANDGREPLNPESMVPYFSDQAAGENYLRNMGTTGGGGFGDEEYSTTTNRVPFEFTAAIKVERTPRSLALDAYRAANNGNEPASPQDVSPYFTDEKEAARYLRDRTRTRQDRNDADRFDQIGAKALLRYRAVYGDTSPSPGLLIPYIESAEDREFFTGWMEKQKAAR